jgi:redox-sensitive bicupin YhaK (pirin superfamily)
MTTGSSMSMEMMFDPGASTRQATGLASTGSDLIRVAVGPEEVGVALRQVVRVVTGQETSDGAGVRLKRSIGTAALDHQDPFLLLDEFRSDDASDYLAGFPDHPHRGFETVTYMLAGAMRHLDHKGNRGELRAGSVQWMTAGRGIIHSEMPQQQDGLMWGFQLWVNLPARLKMTEPRYQDIPPEAVPEYVTEGGARVRVVAGTSGSHAGAVSGIATEPLYLDVTVPAGARFEQPVPAGHTALTYVFEGAGLVGVTEADAGRELRAGQLAVLGDGDGVAAQAGESPLRFLLLAAKPLGEPVARYGPFVMNTEQELIQAFQDFREGRLAD